MSEELPETRVARSQKERRVPPRAGFQEASRVRESYSHGAWDIDLSHCLHLLFTVNLIFWEKSTLSPGRLGFLLLPNQVVCLFFPNVRGGGEGNGKDSWKSPLQFLLCFHVHLLIFFHK